MKSEAGVTLIELVLVIVLMGIIGIVGAQVFLYSTRSVVLGELVRDATQINRMAMDRMIREIRMVRDEYCVAIATQTSLSFIDTQNRVITYNWAGVGNPLQRTEDGATNDLIDNVSNLAFAYFNNADPEVDITGNPPLVCLVGTTCNPALCAVPTDIWSIQVDLTSQSGTETVQFRSRVHPRGFD